MENKTQELEDFLEKIKPLSTELTKLHDSFLKENGTLGWVAYMIAVGDWLELSGLAGAAYAVDAYIYLFFESYILLEKPDDIHSFLSRMSLINQIGGGLDA